MSTISKLVEYKIDGTRVVLARKTVDAIERGGALGAAVTRHVRSDVGTIECAVGHFLKVVGPDGTPLPHFAAN